MGICNYEIWERARDKASLLLKVLISDLRSDSLKKKDPFNCCERATIASMSKHDLVFTFVNKG